MWEGFTPDDYLEYYDYIKERFDIEIDSFEDAPDDIVISGKELELIDTNLWDKKFPRPNLKPGALEPILRDKISVFPFSSLNSYLSPEDFDPKTI